MQLARRGRALVSAVRRAGPVWRRAVAALGCGLLALAASDPAVADEASGTWTGDVELRGNYYWERSTRVVSPELNLNLESPGGARVGAHYLLDSITSASIAAGVLVDVRFTELRNQGGLSAGYELDLGDAQLDLSVDTSVSHEPDYLSMGAGVNAALSLAERATVLRLGVFVLRDDVGKKLRGENRTDPTGRDLSDRGSQGLLHAVALHAGWDQVLARDLSLALGYDLGVNAGFQANPYRMVSVEGTPVPEVHPDFRLRHTLHGRLAYHIDASGTSLHALLRGYADSWDIAAITPEARVYQEIGEHALVRLRYRYYTQTDAEFYSAQYMAGAPYPTADPKMAAFESHLFGVQLVFDLGFLRGSGLEFAEEGKIDVSFEQVLSTSRFGDGVIGQAGLLVPF